MGFKSVMKKIGKGALKAAPIAAAFIPGVGPIASALIGAAAGGTDAAINHKGLKGTLLGAGMGAASGYGADKLSGGKDFTNLFSRGGGSQLLGGVSKSGVDLGSAPTLGGSYSSVVPGVTLGEEGINGVPMAATGFKGALSSSGKYLAKNPVLALAAASMLGGDGTQHRQSYKGDLTSPEHSLYNALAATYRSGQGMMDKKPVRLRGLLPDAPQPVSIPGLGFQIGGGMGHNPAQDDMEVDSMDGYRQQNPFGDVAKKTRL